MEKSTDELAEQLKTVLASGLSDNMMASLKKQVGDILAEIFGDIDWRLKNELSPNLVSWVVEMAEKVVRSLLDGNENEMRRYLGCERGHWNGRSDGDQGYGRKRTIDEWHAVIHGKLFEQSHLALRHALIEAHRDLITSERILDLEDQVASLVAQVNEADRKREEMYERCKSYL